MSNIRNRVRWLRFSSRSLLLLLTVVGICLAFTLRWHRSARRQHDAVAALSADSANIVWYEDGVDPHHDPPPVPQWLRWFVGFDHFYNVADVSLSEATDDQIQLLNDLPNLESLCLFSATECTEVGLAQLRSLSSLKRLTLFDPPALNDRIVAAIGSMNGLQHLQLQCGNKVTDAGLNKLAGLSNLKSLNLKCGIGISDVGLLQIGKLSALEDLGLDLDDATNATIDVSGLSPLVVAYDKPIRGSALGCLGELKRLKSLNLVGGVALTDALSRLREPKGLRSVAIHSKVGITDGALAQLGRLTALETLILDCGQGSETDAGLAKLNNLVKLKKLELHLGSSVSDSGLAHLKDCPSLQRLKLHLNDRVSGDSLSTLERLKYLELDYKPRTDRATLFVLHSPSNIEDLVVHGPTGLTDEDLAGLAGLAELQHIDLFRCNQITNEGFENLKQLSQLKQLGIHWCGQSPNGDSPLLSPSLPGCEISISTGGGTFGFWSRF
jgi:hypothetical protein